MKALRIESNDNMQALRIESNDNVKTFLIINTIIVGGLGLLMTLLNSGKYEIYFKEMLF
jgi:hypothetical protein